MQEGSFAFYIAHAILVKSNVEGTPKLPTPSLLSKFIQDIADYVQESDLA